MQENSNQKLSFFVSFLLSAILAFQLLIAYELWIMNRYLILVSLSTYSQQFDNITDKMSQEAMLLETVTENFKHTVRYAHKVKHGKHKKIKIKIKAKKQNRT